MSKTFEIPLANFARFEAKIERLAAKAEKLGFPTISWMGFRPVRSRRGEIMRRTNLVARGVKHDANYNHQCRLPARG